MHPLLSIPRWMRDHLSPVIDKELENWRMPNGVPEEDSDEESADSDDGAGVGVTNRAPTFDELADEFDAEIVDEHVDDDAAEDDESWQSVSYCEVCGHPNDGALCPCEVDSAISIEPKDVELIVKQFGCTSEEATVALYMNGGDIVEAAEALGEAGWKTKKRKARDEPKKKAGWSCEHCRTEHANDVTECECEVAVKIRREVAAYKDSLPATRAAHVCNCAGHGHSFDTAGEGGNCPLLDDESKRMIRRFQADREEKDDQCECNGAGHAPNDTHRHSGLRMAIYGILGISLAIIKLLC